MLVFVVNQQGEKKEADQLTVSRDVIIRLPDVQSRVKLDIKSRIL